MQRCTSTGTDKEHRCSECERSFSSFAGVQLHRKRKHPLQYNDQLPNPSNRGAWNTDDLRALAARALELKGQGKINIKLNLLFPRRTIQAISSVRKTVAYKRILEDLESSELQLEEVDEEIQPLAGIGESIEVSQDEIHPLPGVGVTEDLPEGPPSFAETSFCGDLSDEEVLSNRVLLIDVLKRKLYGEPRPKATVAGSLVYAITALESNDCDKGFDTLSNLMYPSYGTERPVRQ